MKILLIGLCSLITACGGGGTSSAPAATPTPISPEASNLASGVINASNYVKGDGSKLSPFTVIPNQANANIVFSYTNNGNATAIIDEVKLNLTDQFRLVSTDCSNQILAKASCQIVVQQVILIEGEYNFAEPIIRYHDGLGEKLVGADNPRTIHVFSDWNAGEKSQLSVQLTDSQGFLSGDGSPSSPLLVATKDIQDTLLTLRYTNNGNLPIQLTQLELATPSSYVVTYNDCMSINLTKLGDSCQISFKLTNASIAPQSLHLPSVAFFAGVNPHLQQIQYKWHDQDRIYVEVAGTSKLQLSSIVASDFLSDSLKQLIALPIQESKPQIELRYTNVLAEPIHIKQITLSNKSYKLLADSCTDTQLAQADSCQISYQLIDLKEGKHDFTLPKVSYSDRITGQQTSLIKYADLSVIPVTVDYPIKLSISKVEGINFTVGDGSLANPFWIDLAFKQPPQIWLTLKNTGYKTLRVQMPDGYFDQLENGIGKLRYTSNCANSLLEPKAECNVKVYYDDPTLRFACDFMLNRNLRYYDANDKSLDKAYYLEDQLIYSFINDTQPTSASFISINKVHTPNGTGTGSSTNPLTFKRGTPNARINLDVYNYGHVAVSLNYITSDIKQLLIPPNSCFSSGHDPVARFIKTCYLELAPDIASGNYKFPLPQVTLTEQIAHVPLVTVTPYADNIESNIYIKVVD